MEPGVRVGTVEIPNLSPSTAYSYTVAYVLDDGETHTCFEDAAEFRTTPARGDAGMCALRGGWFLLIFLPIVSSGG